MVVVDSSVWIEFFNGRPGPAADQLAALLDHGEVTIVVPDLVLFEVLRGFREEREWRQARRLFAALAVETAGGEAIALAASAHWRGLRAIGVTVHSPIDVLVATFCIEHDYALLHRDRDFAAFETHRGLRSWRG